MSGNFVFLFAVKRNDVNTQMTAKPEIEPQKTKEQEEWLRLKEGDREAFAAIFHQYYKDLVLYAGTFISHQAEAEDVVQDFFVKLWTEREHISAVKSVKPFLLTAVKPMIYQSGYLTIKDYNMRRNTFLLDFPNDEVKEGFLTVIASDYLKPAEDTGTIDDWKVIG